MNDEIIQKFLNKEIYILQDNSDLSLTINDILLDYITNLENENEMLKEDKKKAVEYIKTTKFLYKSHYDFKQDLLNILQNGSDASVKK